MESETQPLEGARLAALVENLSDGVLVESEDRHILLVNAKFLQLFGIPARPQDLIGTDCSRSAEQSKHMFVDPDAFVEGLDRIVAERAIVRNEELVLTGDRYYQRDYIPTYLDGTYRGHMWIYRDVTDQRRRQAEMREQFVRLQLVCTLATHIGAGTTLYEIIETAVQEIAQYFSNYRVCYGTIDTENTLRIIYAAQPEGMPDHTGLRADLSRVPEYLSAVRRGDVVSVADVRQDLRVSAAAELLSGDRPGAVLHVPLHHPADLQGILCMDAGAAHRWTPHEELTLQEVSRFLGLALRDSYIHEELQRARVRADDASRAKSEFLANMSHEIRTPLNALLGMSEALSETQLSEEQGEYLEVSRRAGEALLTLINDILDFSKIEAGHLELEAVPFRMDDAVQLTLAMFQPRAGGKDIELRYERGPGVPEVLSGDVLRLRQILINLIGNAVKFTATGYVRTSVQLLHDTPAADDEVALEFTVEDTGPGIPPEQRAAIFEAFRQADASITRRHGGSGLGLAISRRLAALMGGTLYLDEAASTTAEGSVFRFTARFKAVEAATSVPGVAAVPERIEVPPGRVLVADDNEDNRRLVEVFLRETPLTVCFAENGREAVDEVQSGDFDLVLMDVEMPEMNGLTAVRTIRHYEAETARSPVRIIALSAHAFQEDIDRCLQAGFDEYMAKPIRKRKLLETIARHSPAAT